jgi:hypothetical protein
MRPGIAPPLPSEENPILSAMKKAVRRRDLGVDIYKIPGDVDDSTKKSYEKAVWEANELMLTKPSWCYKKFSIYYDKEGDYGGHLQKPKDLVERIIWYRVNPWKFAHQVIGTEILSRTASAGKPFLKFTWFQKEYLRDLCDPRAKAIHARCNRGGAKTLLASLSLVILAYCIPRYKMAILSGSEEQSLAAYGYVTTFLEASDLKELLVEGTMLRTRTLLKGGGWIKVLPASEKTVRGLRPDLVYLDECCQAEPPIIIAALGCNVHSAQPKTVLTSTPDKLFHPFREIDLDVDGKGADFIRHHWTCYDCPWIDASMIEERKRIMDKNSFRIEMMGEYGVASGTVYDPDTIEFAVKLGLTPYNDMHDNPWIGATMGVDWGWNHPTVCTITQVDPVNMVCWVTRVEGYRYRTTEDMITDMTRLACEYGVTRIYCDSSHPANVRSFKNRVRDFSIPVSSVPFNKYKDQMISNSRNLLEKQRVGICQGRYNSVLAEQLSAYHFREGKDDIEKKEDDYVDSFNLSIMAMIKEMGMEFLLSKDDIDPKSLRQRQERDVTKMRTMLVYEGSTSDEYYHSGFERGGLY